MTVADFAANHRLKTRVDDDNTTIIPGRHGQIYEYDDQLLGVIYSNPRDKAANRWLTAKRECEAAGMTLQQFGDREGSLSFNPENRAQAKLAIRVAAVKFKRIMSEKQREVARRGLAAANLRVREPQVEQYILPGTGDA
jgi:hypothetical protein